MRIAASDPHRHHHVPILVIRRAIARWAQLTGAMRIFEMERYLRLRGGSQEIQHVAGIDLAGNQRLFDLRPTAEPSVVEVRSRKGCVEIARLADDGKREVAGDG